MSDRLFYALAALAAVLLIALAVVWPQRPGREAGNLSGSGVAAAPVTPPTVAPEVEPPPESAPEPVETTEAADPAEAAQ